MTESYEKIKQLHRISRESDIESNYFNENTKYPLINIIRSGSIISRDRCSVMDIQNFGTNKILIFYTDTVSNKYSSMSIVRTAYSIVKKRVVAKEISIEDAMYTINDTLEQSATHFPVRAFIGIFDTKKLSLSYSSADLGFYKYSKNSKNVELILKKGSSCLGASPSDMVKIVGSFKIQEMKTDRGDIFLFLPDAIIFDLRYFPGEYNSIQYKNSDLGLDILDTLRSILNKERNAEWWTEKSEYPFSLLNFSSFQSIEEDLFGFLFAVITINNMFSMDAVLSQIKKKVKQQNGLKTRKFMKMVTKSLEKYKEFECTEEVYEYMKRCSDIVEHIESISEGNNGLLNIRFKDVYNSPNNAFNWDVMAMALQLYDTGIECPKCHKAIFVDRMGVSSCQFCNYDILMKDGLVVNDIEEVEVYNPQIENEIFEELETVDEMEKNNAMMCRVSIKKSYKRGIWQIKEPEHNIYGLGRVHDILEKCMVLSGIDVTDRSQVHNFIYSDQAFDGYQLKLVNTIGYYHITDNPNLSGVGSFPSYIFKFFKIIPDVLYIRIEKGIKETGAGGLQEIKVISENKI